MENLKYQQAANRVSFLKNLIFKIFYMLVFNGIYMAYNYFEKGIFFNRTSVFFVVFSVMFLIHFITKFWSSVYLLKKSNKGEFSKAQKFFIINLSVFMAYLIFKFSVDFLKFFIEGYEKVSITNRFELLHGYDFVLVWIAFLGGHYYLTFKANFFKNWEEKKIKKLMSKNP